MLRTCKKCGETKEIEEFAKNKECKYGHTFRCKKCSNKDNKKYGVIYRLNNKDHIKEYNKVYKLNHKHERKQYYINNHNKLLLQKYKWVKSNPEKVKISNAEYRKRNIEHIKEKNKMWRIINSQKLKLYRENNRDHLRKLNKIYVERLPDAYISKILHGIKHPVLIEAKRIQIQLLRLTKE